MAWSSATVRASLPTACLLKTARGVPLLEGGSVSQIDNALTDFGYPVGPFGMQDIAGIDVGWRIRQHLKSAGKTRAEGPQAAVPDRLYELGRYGQKTGAGWYRYEPGSRTRISDPLVDEIAAEEAARRGATRGTVSDETIIARIMTALATRAAGSWRRLRQPWPATSTSLT